MIHGKRSPLNMFVDVAIRLLIGPPAPIMPILPVITHGELGNVRHWMSCPRCTSRQLIHGAGNLVGTSIWYGQGWIVAVNVLRSLWRQHQSHIGHTTSRPLARLAESDGCHCVVIILFLRYEIYVSLNGFNGI